MVCLGNKPYHVASAATLFFFLGSIWVTVIVSTCLVFISKITQNNCPPPALTFLPCYHSVCAKCWQFACAKTLVKGGVLCGYLKKSKKGKAELPNYIPRLVSLTCTRDRLNPMVPREKKFSLSFWTFPCHLFSNLQIQVVSVINEWIWKSNTNLLGQIYVSCHLPLVTRLKVFPTLGLIIFREFLVFVSLYHLVFYSKAFLNCSNYTLTEPFWTFSTPN